MECREETVDINVQTDCRKTGKTLFNGHDSSTDDDPVAIGTACFWLGDQRSAEFLALEMQGDFPFGGEGSLYQGSERKRTDFQGDSSFESREGQTRRLADASVIPSPGSLGSSPP